MERDEGETAARPDDGEESAKRPEAQPPAKMKVVGGMYDPDVDIEGAPLDDMGSYVD